VKYLSYFISSSFAGLVAQIKASSADASLAAAACEALGVACFECEENRQVCSESGACEAVVASIRTHSATAGNEVARWGAYALCILADDHPVNGAALARADAVGALRDAAVAPALRGSAALPYIRTALELLATDK
jgi:hypothetical protein